MHRPGRAQLGRAWTQSSRQSFSPIRTPLPLIRHLHTSPFMARKSARALAAAEASPPAEDHPSSSKVSLSELSPKSCLTCGRMITPRAKWAKDWDGIKYCSDRCRSTRPGKVTVSFQIGAGSIGCLEECNGVTRDDGQLKVDVESFVEGVLLEVVNQNGGGTLEDAQDRIKRLLVDASIPTGSSDVDAESGEKDEDRDQNDTTGHSNSSSGSDLHPLWKALDSPPGLRERLRRAARRLALGITHESDTRQTHITTTETGSIELLQNSKPLRTVQDLSFAKGIIHVRLKKS